MLIIKEFVFGNNRTIRRVGSARVDALPEFIDDRCLRGGFDQSRGQLAGPEDRRLVHTWYFIQMTPLTELKSTSFVGQNSLWSMPRLPLRTIVRHWSQE